MKKWYKVTILVVVLVMSLAMAATALAADLNPGQIGAACAPGEIGTWHFVNNQTGGAASGFLTAEFNDAGVYEDVGALVVNKNNQHFFITGPAGPLLSASTDLPGRLVLSDLDCDGKKPPDPK